MVVFSSSAMHHTILLIFIINITTIQHPTTQMILSRVATFTVTSFVLASVSSFNTLPSTSVSTSLRMSSATEPKPKLPLPKPLLSLTPGTWAYDTMTRRIDSEILERTFQENKEEYLNDERFAASFQKFQTLRTELQNSANTPLRYLAPLPTHMIDDPIALREYNEWKQILSPYLDKDKPDTWLSTPWLVAEFYLYRRLMETLDYFNPKSLTYLFDPFAKQKGAGLETSVATAEPILSQLNGLGKKPVKDGFALAVAFALWGNKMDLSIWPAESMADAPGMFQKILESANDNLLHDDTAALVSYGEKLLQKGGGAIDIIVDNAGFELIMDLALADFLIASGVAKVVRFQLKSHPTFVSDALEKDLREHVQYYSELSGKDYASCKMAGERWLGYLDSEKWTCNENSFWVQPPPMWEMPSDLRGDLQSRCDLAFVKGDANYRRLLGDLEWDFSAPFEDVVGHYFPCPVCALRTLKAEVGCGMEKDKVQRAKTLDENWCTNGRFGVVHFSFGSDN